MINSNPNHATNHLLPEETVIRNLTELEDTPIENLDIEQLQLKKIYMDTLIRSILIKFTKDTHILNIPNEILTDAFNKFGIDFKISFKRKKVSYRVHPFTGQRHWHNSDDDFPLVELKVCNMSFDNLSLTAYLVAFNSNLCPLTKDFPIEVKKYDTNNIIRVHSIMDDLVKQHLIPYLDHRFKELERKKELKEQSIKKKKLLKILS